MNRGRGRWVWLAAIAFATATAGAACARATTNRSESPSRTTDDRGEVIEHLVPARDSIGREPARFAWTAVAGAQEYSVGIWNDVDMMIWRQNHVAATSIDRPTDLTLEPGTYFWSISALREGEQIAESGLAAFIVRTVP